MLNPDPNCIACGNHVWSFTPEEMQEGKGLCRDCKIASRKAELDALTAYFGGDPVLPLSKVCDAVTSWARCIEAMNKEEKTANAHVEEIARRLSITHLNQAPTLDWSTATDLQRAPFVARAQKMFDAGIRAMWVGGPQGARYFEVLQPILIDIRKSALLWRLLYQGQKVRNVKCAIHKGHLAMHQWMGSPSEGEKPCACNGTGWLP